MENRKLSHDITFNCCLYGGIILAALFGVLIGYAEYDSRKICLSAECFSNLLVIFTFPLQIVAAGLVLAGIRATVFRSSQTALQINETIKQNTFKNYFDHKKDFMSLLDDLEAGYKIKFYDKKSLYKVLFPLNSPVSFDVVSRDRESMDSPLLFWIKEYNEVIHSFNKRSDILEAGVADQTFVALLARLQVTIAESRISIGSKEDKENCRVSEHHLASKFFTGSDCGYNYFPVNLYKAINSVSAVFEILLSYCVPNEEMQVSRLNGVERSLNEKLRYVCGHLKLE